MAQNITLMGASYSDVPSVLLPKTGGGTASFTDVTDTTASANDVAAGKYFYTAAGVKTEGTSTGGGGTTAGTVTQDANGYIVLDDDAPTQPTLITKSITANGTYNASSDNADGYSSVTVNVSGGGGGGGDMTDPIRFFDYDGTLVASYTSVPASLPSVPTHTGLTNGTWNYTLQQVTTQFNAMGTCDVGANYTTSSGATEIDIVLQEGRLHPYLSLAVNGTVSIDWGDNTTPDSVTGTDLSTRISTINHEYSQAGSYTIKISKTSGTGYALKCTSIYTLLNKNTSDGNPSRVYSNCVKAVRVGANCSLGSYAFGYLWSIESVSLPSNVEVLSNSTYIFGYCYSLPYVSIPQSLASNTSINYMFYSCYCLEHVSIAGGVSLNFGTHAFYACYNLKSISVTSNTDTIGNNTFYYCYSIKQVEIPNGVTSIGSSAFTNCYNFSTIDIPNGVTSIGNNAFSGCYSVSTLEIPASVTSIGNNAFNYCYGMKEYHFLRTESVPTLGTTAFGSIQSDCIIYVPNSKLNDYKTAENWATYASYMVGE